MLLILVVLIDSLAELSLENLNPNLENIFQRRPKRIVDGRE